MTTELAEYLIGLDKYIIHEGEKVNSFDMNIENSIDFRLYLTAPADLDQNLIVDIKESKKKSLKITLHHQDQSTNNGLLRIDYNGGHMNPMIVTQSVPEKFIPFAGLRLDEYPGHIHYFVSGYKPLAWAIPLEDDDFPVKQLTDQKEYIDILKAFFIKINLKTTITYKQQMRLI